MSARAAVRATGAGDPLRTLRVALVVDPETANPVTPDVGTAINLHLHLVALAAIDGAMPFLRQADVIIVEVRRDVAGAVDDLARLIASQPRPVIAAAQALDAATVRALMRAGAIDVIALPLEPGELDEALQTARALLASHPQIVAKGRVISLFRAVGGAGATTLATQAGCLWSARQTTCLIDFDIQFGAAALYLDMQPPLGLIDLIEARDRLDHTLLSTIAARHSSGLHVIAAPREITPLEAVTPAIVAHVLTLAAQAFDIVLVDLPAAWTPWTLAALAHSDAACLVTNLSVPGLRQARRQLDLIEANAVVPPISVVLNRVPKKLFRTIDLGDSERVLRRPVDFTIADDFATMSSAIDQGRAIGTVRRRSPAEHDITAIVDGLSAAFAA